MNHGIILLAFLGHIAGDFYFQSNGMARKKAVFYSWMLLHSLTYAAMVFIFLIPAFSAETMLLAGGMAVVHFIIDTAKFIFWRFAKKRSSFPQLLKSNIKSTMFFADQLLHIATIYILVYFAEIPFGGYSGGFLPALDCFFTRLAGCDTVRVLSVLLLALTLGKPVNVAISTMFRRYKPHTPNTQDTLHAGAWIGTLERMIIAIFTALNQYSAMAFVLTAKSVARYNKISEDSKFAQYYLIGTLASCLLSVVLTKLII